MRNCNKWEKGKDGLPTIRDSRSIRAGLLKASHVELSMSGLNLCILGGSGVIFNML